MSRERWIIHRIRYILREISKFKIIKSTNLGKNLFIGYNKALLNINEFCDYLGIRPTKARELLRGRNGFGVQIGNRWYANKRKLDAWIDKETN